MSGHDKLFGDQTVIVVGGGAGIGREYCHQLAQQGAAVFAVGRGSNVFDVVDGINAAGGSAKACVADARDGEAIVCAALRWRDRIDGMIVNAGIVRDRSYAKMSPEEWRDVIDVHLEASHACTRAIWSHMTERHYGRIMLTGSTAGIHGNFGQANYAAAKSAILGLTRVLALEGASCGIHVNAVLPLAATGMSEALLGPGICEALPASAIPPFVLAMMHRHARETGAILETGGGWGGLLRWQRAAGRRFAADELSLDQVIRHWDDIARFDAAADFPSSGMDSLRRAVGPGLAATLRSPVRAQKNEVAAEQ